MRRGNIISVAALVLTLALSGGCQRLINPGADSGTISFATSSLQLSTGVTKGGTTKEGTTFSTDGSDSFAVFGWHAEAEEGEKWIFDNEEVTCGAISEDRNTTSYTPLQPWEWGNSATDYYDFIAFYYESDVPAYTKSADPTTVLVPYDATDEQYDLMAAGTRRNGDATDPNAVVPLEFRHLLCAVKVTVINDSKEKNFTLKKLHFKGLVVMADAELTITSDPDTPFSFIWTDLAVNTTYELFGFDCGEGPGITVNPGVSNAYSWPDGVGVNGNYNLLVPQTLTASTKLEMSFTYDNGGVPKNSTLSLGLSTVPNETDGQLLTTWVAGYKYEYQIHIRVDGGVVVSVITTEWDPVEGQTHGIML